MWLIDQLAERHIRQAVQRGEFDALPGAGKPLALEAEPLVPEQLRAGYRLLKNAGYLPPEFEALREVRALAALLPRVQTPALRERTGKRLRLLEARLAEDGRPTSAVAFQYRERLLDALAVERDEA